MSVEFDGAAAKVRYAAETDEELVRVAYLQADDYVPEAIALAREELARRGVDGHRHASVARTAVTLRKERAVANKPLDTGEKLLCLLMPGIGMFVAYGHTTKGRKRQAKEAWRWVGYGYACAGALLVLGLLLATLTRKR